MSSIKAFLIVVVVGYVSGLAVWLTLIFTKVYDILGGFMFMEVGYDLIILVMVFNLVVFFSRFVNVEQKQKSIISSNKNSSEKHSENNDQVGEFQVE